MSCSGLLWSKKEPLILDFHASCTVEKFKRLNKKEKKQQSWRGDTSQIHFFVCPSFVSEAQLNGTMQAWHFLMEVACFHTYFCKSCDQKLAAYRAKYRRELSPRWTAESHGFIGSNPLGFISLWANKDFVVSQLRWGSVFISVLTQGSL